MSVKETGVTLPPLRKYIFRNSLMIVGLFAIFGIFMMFAVFLASGITPRLIHLNYDSIAAADQMKTAWTALRHPEDYSPKDNSKEVSQPPTEGRGLPLRDAKWIQQFDQAITFEFGNITEPGELQLAKNIRELWKKTQNNVSHLDLSVYQQMNDYLKQLVQLNERGMFALASESNSLSRWVFIVSILLLFFSIFLALYMADNLAVRIALPLRELAATLRRKPVPGTKLKLPQSNSLEMRIFTHEMLMLWERLSELRKFNLVEISAQRNKLEAVLSAVDDAILVLDNQEKVIHCNQGMLDLIGLGNAEVLGHPWRDISTTSENYVKLRDLLRPEISSEQTVELQFKQSKRVFSGRCRPFHGETGEQIGSLYLLHDITEIKSRDRLKTEFIGMLSHELKTPLQSLGTASELLYDRKIKRSSPQEGLSVEPCSSSEEPYSASVDEEKMLIETIHEDVGRIRAVANEFVQVGLVDLQTLRLKIEKVPISELLPQWIQPFQVLAKDRGIKVQYQKEGSELIYGQIDTVKFPWSISNLISNAIRVSLPQGVVIVYLTDRGGRVDIEVRDDGPGVSEEIQRRMFDPYFQGSASSSGFLGLGLTITKEVVEAHEGRIEYFKKLPHGSVFRISLPLAN